MVRGGRIGQGGESVAGYSVRFEGLVLSWVAV